MGGFYPGGLCPRPHYVLYIKISCGNCVDMFSDVIFSIIFFRQVSRDKKDLQMAIRTHKERNSMLERLSSELNQELQEVMEQRIALEIQLEHLKPVYS